MNRKEILKWLDGPARLSREERLIVALEMESSRADELALQLCGAELENAALRRGGKPGVEYSFIELEEKAEGKEACAALDF